MEIMTFTEYYKRQIKTAFIILVGLSVLISILDLFTLDPGNTHIKTLNIVTIGILLLCVILHFRFRLSLSLFFTIALYTVLLNLFLSQIFTEMPDDKILLLVFRGSIFYILMLIFSGLFIHKIHAVIILLFIVFRYVNVAVKYKPEFLLDNLVVFMITFAVITAIVYIFSGNLHRSIKIIQQKQAEIIQANIGLKEASEDLRAAVEDLSIKNKKLQEMNTGKDKIFSIISHDLKNPMNVLKGFIDLMIRKGKNLEEEKKDLYLLKMRESVNSLTGLLNDLLDWSRSQSGSLNYEPQAFLMHELAESVCLYVKNTAEAKKITILNLVDEHYAVYADFNMIFTVLRNLVSNAIKFSFPGKQVRVITGIEEGHLVTSVIDNGTGIDREDMSKVFDFRAHLSNPGTDNEKGSGLGLILCKEFVEKNHGVLGFDSEEGKGSTFWFSLPLHKK